jgi:predicted lipoprotein with Yx(FWY)xxD motif
MSGSSFRVGLLGAAATVLLAAGCGSGTAASGGGSSPAKSVSGGVLGVATTSLGPVLVNGKGLTVYLLTADSPGHSTCSAQCLAYWPLVPGPAGTSSVKGVSAVLGAAKGS